MDHQDTQRERERERQGERYICPARPSLRFAPGAVSRSLASLFPTKQQKQQNSETANHQTIEQYSEVIIQCKASCRRRTSHRLYSLLSFHVSHTQLYLIIIMLLIFQFTPSRISSFPLSPAPQVIVIIITLTFPFPQSRKNAEKGISNSSRV